MNFRFRTTTSTVTNQEIDEPIGWDTAELTIKRDIERYHGLFFGYTTEFEFNGNAFRLYKAEFELHGLDGQALIYVDLDCGSGWKQVFYGNLDFATYSDVKNSGCSCTMDITQSTLEMLTVNRQEIMTNMEAETSIDGYDISGNTFFDLLMHNYTLEYNGRWQADVSVQSVLIDTAATSFSGGYMHNRNPICIQNNEIGGMTECLTTGTIYPLSPPSGADLAQEVVIFTAPRSSIYYIDFILSGYLRNQTNVVRDFSYTYSFQKINFAGIPTTAQDVIHLTSVIGQSGTHTAPFAVNSGFVIFLFAGEKLTTNAAWFNYTNTTSPVSFTTNTLHLDAGSYISIREESSYGATEARAVKLYDAFWKAIANYTGSKDAFYSLLLGYPGAPDREYLSNGCASYTALSNGYLIRGFPDKKLYVALNELFDSTDAIWNIGLGFEVQSDNVLRCRVEEKEFFYSQNALLGIYTDVNEIKTSVRPDLAYNQFKLGFEQFKVEEGTDKLNTNTDYLTQFTWSTASKNIKNTFTRLSKYIGSLFIIEYTRRNRYIDNATKESKYDESNFLIAMNRSGLDQAEKNERFTTVNGVLHPDEAYNLRFNLFSTLLRWSNIFNASISRLPSKILKFTFGSLNNDLTLEYSDAETCEGDYSGEEFITNQDLSFDDEDNTNKKPLYEPIIYEFAYPLSFAEYNTFRNYPGGTIIFGRNLQSLIQGFILEVKYSPVKGLANFTLLRSYEQNVEAFFPPLIDIFSLPMGFIVEYSGTMSIWDATGKGTGIYSRFALCNGNNGTPNLKGQFTVCYNPDDADYSSIGNTGGSKTHTLTGAQSGQKPLSVPVKVGAENALATTPTLLGGNQMNNGAGGTAGPNVNAFGAAQVDISGASASEPFDNRPNYYVVAKVMLIE